MKTAQHIVIVSSPHGSTVTLVLSVSNVLAKFLRGHPAGSINTGGVQTFNDFRPISRYILQTIQDSTIVGVPNFLDAPLT